MKLNGVVTFAALFTLLNEFEQIRYQAFVPTKSLSHLKAGLEAMVTALKEHGLVEPILGFTDNVASDEGTFSECIPSLNKNVRRVDLDEHSDLPRLLLPEDIFLAVNWLKKRGKSYVNTIEFGRLAAKKKVVPNGQASLASIVAASLQHYLSKEFHSTEWAAEKLTDDQIQYAALDAYAALMVWDVLKKIEHNGQPLSAATAEEIQKDQTTFKAINNQEQALPTPPKEKCNIGTPRVIKPPNISSFGSKIVDDLDSESESESEHDNEVEINNSVELERTSGFTQTANDIAVARILADVFHEMDKVCRTISKKHTLSKKFATAFSDTLLVPDKDDKKLVSEVFLKKNLTYDKIRSKSPSWLWKRIRRYIPEINILVLV
ncbi:hypothetical protein K443DRAFT_125800 [Laccaria amethystina LaAM-08-1]|uniref:Unplaced genomic scaffold K443scaffold_347, whole genome shotgun sequence n=1 Tax=Laccaria amethystina LaAM-08-1 TaxID=1095629 RepID=A0A0C9X8Z9_9AGAR|nr:hypothetical protein K443DRAFT_125800 [Laccaria amethystina LaAM-08-1]